MYRREVALAQLVERTEVGQKPEAILRSLIRIRHVGYMYAHIFFTRAFLSNGHRQFKSLGRRMPDYK